MTVKQLSVFVENKPGRLSMITRILGNAGVDIRAMSVADTKDFGILRLIVNDTDKALEVLKENSFLVQITRVIAVGIPDTPGGLADVMETLYENNISVEYMYAFISKVKDRAFVILRVENNDKAIEALREKDYPVICGSDIYNM